MSSQEEDKPTPSGRPRPGIEPQKKEEKPQQERKLHPGRGDIAIRESITGKVITDVRFWIFFSGMLIGILIGLAF